MKAAIIVNTKNNPRKELQDVKTHFSQWDIRVYTTTKTREAFTPTKSALKLKPDILIVLGGDGTVHQVINAIATSKSNATLAIVPIGKSNDLSSHLGISSPQQAIKAIQRGTSKRIDLLYVNKTYIATSAAVGLPASVVAAVPNKKSILGQFVYALEATKQLLFQKTGIYTKGSNKQYLLISIHNQPKMNFFNLAPNAKNTDGKLEICKIIHPPLFIISMFLIFRTIFGKHTQSKYIRLQSATTCRLTFTAPLELMGDGEILGTFTEVNVVVKPKKLAVIYS